MQKGKCIISRECCSLFLSANIPENVVLELTNKRIHRNYLKNSSQVRNTTIQDEVEELHHIINNFFFFYFCSFHADPYVSQNRIKMMCICQTSYLKRTADIGIKPHMLLILLFLMHVVCVISCRVKVNLLNRATDPTTCLYLYWYHVMAMTPAFIYTANLGHRGNS